MKINPKIQGNIQQIDSIENGFFRDLVAFLYSPNSFSQFFENKLEFKISESKSFDVLWDWYNSVKELPTPLKYTHLRLGQYAELLLFFYFQNSKNYKLLAANLQLNENKITKGEIDYLLENDSEKIHLELAIKFYLKVELSGEMRRIGPSAKDNFKRKKDKLLNHQLLLTTKHQNLLPEKFQKLDFKPQLLIKGAEFLPFSEYKISENPFLNTWWIHRNEAEKILFSKYEYTFIPIRRNWIFPFYSNAKKVSYEKVIQEIENNLVNRNEIMICRFLKDRIPVDYGFVVVDSWPQEL